MVGEAADGMEAVPCVRELNPDLVLLDLWVPRMNGMAAPREIKRNCPETRVVRLTVHKTEEYLFATLEVGDDVSEYSPGPCRNASFCRA